MKQSGGRPLPWQNTNRSSHPYKKRNKNGTTDLILPLQNNRQPSPWSVSIPILPTPLLFADWDCPDGWREHTRYRSKGGSSIRQKKFPENIWNDRKTISDTPALYPHHPEDTETRTVQLYNSPSSNNSAATSRIAPEKYPAGILVDLNRAGTPQS